MQFEVPLVDSVLSGIADADAIGVEVIAHVHVAVIHALGNAIHRRSVEHECLDPSARRPEELLANGEAACQRETRDAAVVGDGARLGSRHTVPRIVEGLVVAAIRLSEEAMLHAGGIGIVTRNDVAIVDSERGDRYRPAWQRDRNISCRLPLRYSRQNKAGCRQQQFRKLAHWTSPLVCTHNPNRNRTCLLWLASIRRGHK